MSSEMEIFADTIWEEFVETGKDHSEWPKFFDEAVGHYNAIREDV